MKIVIIAERQTKIVEYLMTKTYLCQEDFFLHFNRLTEKVFGNKEDNFLIL